MYFLVIGEIFFGVNQIVIELFGEFVEWIKIMYQKYINAFKVLSN